MKIISGKFGGRSLSSVSGPGLRPAMAKVRAALFSMLEARGVEWEGARVLDVFAGLGSLGFEALSRGASEAWFVEKSSLVCRQLRENAKKLGLGPQECLVIAKDARAFLDKPCGVEFRAIFIDPPYGLELLQPCLELVGKGGWLEEGGIVAAEIEAKLDISGLAKLERLEQTADRDYGQTRVVLWRTR